MKTERRTRFPRMLVHIRKADPLLGPQTRSSCRQPFPVPWVEAVVALSLDSPVSLLHEITDVLNVPFISVVWLNLPKEKCAVPSGRPDPINHELTVTFSWFSFLLFNTKLSQKSY